MTAPSITSLVTDAVARASNLAHDAVHVDADLIELGIDSLTLAGIVNTVSLSLGIIVDEASMASLLTAQTLGDFTMTIQALAEEPVP